MGADQKGGDNAKSGRADRNTFFDGAPDCRDRRIRPGIRSVSSVDE